MSTHKFQRDQIVTYGSDRTGVVVALRKHNTRPYLVVETDPSGKNARGSGLWLRSSDLTRKGKQYRVKPGRNYRHNLKLDQTFDDGRGCHCNCCPHVSEHIYE